jgi:hypothetical protein
MEPEAIRGWIGAYVLALTAVLGGYLLLAPDILLPLEASDKTSSFEIILPFLLAQVAAVYRFYTDQDARKRLVSHRIPKWAVKGPPLLVTLLLITQLAQF